MRHYPFYLVLLTIGVLVASYLLGLTPPLVGLLYFLMSVTAFTLYARDKIAAVKGEWRTPENTLHIIDLLGGWPGALLAQNRFRHKTKKVSFRSVFWVMVFLNVSAFGWLHHPSGNLQMRYVTLNVEYFFLTQTESKPVIRTVSFFLGLRR